MILRTVLSVTIVLALSLFFVPVVSAHNLEPRVEISIDRLNPGGVVDVRGVSFDMDEPVTLTLIGPGVEIALGEVVSDAEGVFLHIVQLPVDLAEGTYYFRAVSTHHFVLSPPLTVWGTTITEGGGQGPRDEDDGLLAPFPTYPPAVATVPVHQAPVAAVPAPTWTQNWIALIASMLVGIILVFGILRKKLR